MEVEPPLEHYQHIDSKFPPLSPYDPRWRFWASQWLTEGELISWTWGHLPPAIQSYYLDVYRKYQREHLPELNENFLIQLSEAMLKNWDLFGPILESILKQTKEERKRK